MRDGIPVTAGADTPGNAALAPLAQVLAHVAEAAWSGDLGPGHVVFEPGEPRPVPAVAVPAAVRVRSGARSVGWLRAAAAEDQGQGDARRGVEQQALSAWLEGVGDALAGIFGEPVAVEALEPAGFAAGPPPLCFSYAFGGHRGTAWLWLDQDLLAACLAALGTPGMTGPAPEASGGTSAPPAGTGPGQSPATGVPDPFPPLSEERALRSESGTDLLLDVPLEVSVELGRTHRPIREILALVPGSVLELDRLAGDPIDVLINGRPIALAEVVVVDERFAIRITDILTPEERVVRLV